MTLTLDDLQSHIVRFVSSTSTHITIGYMAPLRLIVTNGRTDGRMDRHFSHMLTGHLLQSKEDLKMAVRLDGDPITPPFQVLKIIGTTEHLQMGQMFPRNLSHLQIAKRSYRSNFQ